MLHFPDTPFEPVNPESLPTKALIELQRHLESKAAIIRNKLAEMRTDFECHGIKTPKFERAALSEELTVLGTQISAIRDIRTIRSHRVEEEQKDVAENRRKRAAAQRMKWHYTDLLLANLLTLIERDGLHYLVREARKMTKTDRGESKNVSGIFDVLQETHGADLIRQGEPFSPRNRI